MLSGYHITVELKSVNHRYFEFYSRIPRAYGYLDEKLKSLVHEHVYRGKVEAYVGITPIDTTDTQVEINTPLAQSYLEELRKLGETLGLKDDLTLSRIAGFHDIFSLQRVSENEELLWTLVEEVTLEALTPFNEMRRIEGLKMKEDVSNRLDLLEQYTKEIQRRSPDIVADWRNRLEEKLQEVLGNKQIEESRLVTEAAIFAEKVAVDEETVRLQSHILQFRSILKESQTIGRKLDFLVQEINRETNTIGSKSQDVEASKLVVEMKSETEKIREQIQNIE